MPIIDAREIDEKNKTRFSQIKRNDTAVNCLQGVPKCHATQ